MSVQMHGMYDGEIISEYHLDRGILAKIVYIPFGVVGVGGIAHVCKEQERITMRR